MKIRKEDALLYHSMGRKGKIEVITTKPCVTQRDLSLAYSPGVAEPCLEIHKDPSKVYEYTAKGNLVAVVSNGTAVLGLGDLGPMGGKPVMEGKGVLFKTFADIDVFDIELDSKDIDEIVRVVEVMAPTFGGINLEDIKGPECFHIEEELKKRLDIPVFHDDQHGTAIISGAALLNALEIVGKKIEDVKVVYNGAGASGIACAKFHMSLGVRPENVLMCDSGGVIYKGRTKGMNIYKEEFIRDTECRTLADALVGADVFAGLSQGNCVTGDMIKPMAPDPIIFAMANPDPEIPYEEAIAARPDVIMATGRSDYPNQVNNVLGFPFIFRGALDVHAKAINEEMKQAAAYALAKLAKEEVPEVVRKAYDGNEIKFGRLSIIPKPFDPRVLTWVAPAVAKAAMDTGVARKPIEDWDEYRRSLDIRMGRAQGIMTPLFHKAQDAPKTIVYPEGDNHKIIKAAQLAADNHIAKPILLGDEAIIRNVAEQYSIDISELTIVDPAKYEKLPAYIDEYYRLRQRKGITMKEAKSLMLTNTNYFGAMMVHLGDADGMISGITHHYPDTIRPALQIIGKDPEYKFVSSCYIISAKNQTYFLADATINVNPSPEAISDITIAASRLVKTFDITPKAALLSFSNFGSAKGDTPKKMREALKLINQRCPELICDGEIQADIAVAPDMLEQVFPFSPLKGGANVLVVPNLESGNIAYKLLNRIGGARLIGPVVMGLSRSVHVLQRGSEIDDILNMTALAVVDAKNKSAK